jgi:hypothetical protein
MAASKRVLLLTHNTFYNHANLETIETVPPQWGKTAHRRFNFQTPAVYYSMRRNADGLYDPASGEYHGLSMAYEVDAVPAFLTPLPPKVLAASRSGPK